MYVNSNLKLKEAVVDDTAVPTGAQVYIKSVEHQLQSASRNYIWRGCVSAAIKSLKRCRSGRHSRLD